MARILVVFGTTDGHTARIARRLADVLREEGHAVDLIDSRAPPPLAPFRGVDAAIVAGSLRMGRFQRKLVRFVREHRDELAGIPNAFVAVSLSAARASEAARREVRKTIDGFVAETGFTPASTQLVAGALLYTKYGWFTRRIMRFISRKVGGDTDTSRDYVYTDWTALSEFARRFAERLREGSPNPQEQRDAPFTPGVVAQTVRDAVGGSPR